MLFVGFVVWALAPLCVWFAVFPDETQIWLGDLRVVLVVCLVWFLVCCDLPALMDLLGPCTNDVLTAYAHVRTEPQCDIGHTRVKKNRKFEQVQTRKFEQGSNKINK